MLFVSRLLIATLAAASSTPEWTVQAPEVVGPGAAAQSHPVIGSFDGGQLLVWADGRNGDTRLFASPLTPEGGVSAPAGRPVAPPTAQDPGVACSATQCLVVWSALSSWDIGGSIRMSVLARRVGFDGAAIDPQPLNLGSGAVYYYSYQRPAVASDGTDFLVLFQTYPSGQLRLQSAIVTAAGQVQPGPPFPAPLAPGKQWFPSLSWTGAGYLATWDEAASNNVHTLRAARLDATGADLDDGGVTLEPDAGGVWLLSSACNGSACLSAWRTGTPGSLRGIWSNLDGTPRSAIFQLSAEAGSSAPLALAPEGDDFLLGWDNGRQVKVARYSKLSVLTPLGTFEPPQPSGTARLPALSAGDPKVLAFASSPGNDTNVALRWLDLDGGVPWSEAMVPLLPPAQSDPVSIPAQGGGVCAWIDYREGGLSLRSAVVDPRAGLLPGEGALIASAQNQPVYLAGARCGSGSVLAWSSASQAGDRIELATFDAHGAPTGGTKVLAGPVQNLDYSLAVGGGPDECLVAWTQYGAGWDLLAARVAPEGTVLDATPFPVAVANGSQLAPQLAWDGSAFLLAWADGAGTAISAVRTRRIGVDGSGGDGGSVVLAATTRPELRIACNGSSCFALWVVDRKDGSMELHGAPFESGSGPGDAGLLLDTVHPGIGGPELALVGDPPRFYAGWTADGTDAGALLRVARLEPNGPAVAWTMDLPAAGGEVSDPSLARIGPGRLLASYEVKSTVDSDVPVRVRARYVLDEPPGEPCSAEDAGLASGAECSDAGPRRMVVSCDCGAAPAGAGMWLAGVLMIALLRSRRSSDPRSG